MKTAAIIQARMGSSRLPEKVLMKLDSKNPLIFFVINQLKYAKNIDEIIIATTKESQDNKIEKFCIENKIDFFRGSTNDVLDRYYQCSKQFSISNFFVLIIYIGHVNSLN